MIIPVKRGDSQEWAIIELQGDLSFHSADITNLNIGDLHFTKTGKPIFIIGPHVLYGKEIDLTTPIAVLEKKCVREASSNDGKDSRVNEETMDDSNEEIEYLVKAIVKKKLIFKERPKPIIKNVPKSI